MFRAWTLILWHQPFNPDISTLQVIHSSEENLKHSLCMFIKGRNLTEHSLSSHILHSLRSTVMQLSLNILCVVLLQSFCISGAKTARQGLHLADLLKLKDGINCVENPHSEIDFTGTWFFPSSSVRFHRMNVYPGYARTMWIFWLTLIFLFNNKLPSKRHEQSVRCEHSFILQGV